MLELVTSNIRTLTINEAADRVPGLTIQREFHRTR